jgi:hypothetical protein
MRNKKVVTIAALAGTLFLAFVLNPSPERHRARIKEDMHKHSQLAAALGLGSVAAFASTYHSLGIASYTTAGDRTLSIGVLGMVFVLE